MKLENHVCSLEYAKRLKELGVKQESFIYWMNVQHCVHFKTKKDEYGLDQVECDENGNELIDKIDYRIDLGNPLTWNIPKEDTWSAFFVSEISKIIFQKNYDYLEEMGYLNITNEMIDKSGSYFYRITNNLTDHIIDEANQADALAKLFIILFGKDAPCHE